MSLTSLPFELLLLIASAVTDGRDGRLHPAQTLKSIYALSRTCRVIYGNLCWKLYRYDVDRGESSALLWAAVTNNPKTAKLSLASGGDTRATNQHGQSPLWLAARRGYRDIVEILLDHGADIEIRNPVGLTPLAIASREGCCEIMKVLLHRGAKHATQTPDHSTPLLWAIRAGATDAVKLLIEHGAQLPEPSTTPWRRWALAAYRAGPARWVGIPEIQALMESSHDPNQGNQLSVRPFLHAMQHQFLAMSTFILDQCITSINDLGSFFGHCPADEPMYDKSRQGIERVIWAGWRATEQRIHFGRPQNSPLWWAVYHGEEEFVEKLLKRGAGTNSQTDRYRHDRKPTRLLSLALVRGFPGIAELLLDCGADANYYFWDGSLLIRVLRLGNERLVMKVLSSLNMVGALHIANQRRPLVIAIGKQNATLVRMLLEFGADPNVEFSYVRKAEDGHKYEKRQTILSIAIQRGNRDVVETLLEYGAE
ncbi:uncharacterized protein N7482_003986 [Penicillium canariense]|uniref:Uncharacterized protein n=1 Tax=Penicillium canariense TaxID=189055 RepID=A0A9W9IBH7_9EURO|nr:uncharacterized protein N7482_003986 [Penicillium canariense]KAJ5168392.1 hypothetical protein N7482_003986 [Penicillium canariense]